MIRPGDVAARRRAAYLRRVSPPRLIRFLVMLVLVLAPFAMLAGNPAQATSHHEAIASADAGPSILPCHTADEPSQENGSPSVDCALACAATMPEPGGALHALSRPRSAPLPPGPVTVGQGLAPEATDPPPRNS